MHAILFDIDGTLINSRGAGRAALAKAFGHVFNCDEEVEIEMSGRTDRAIARDWFAAHGLENSEENWQKLSAGYLAHLPATLAERDGHVLPGVPELLALLRQGDDHLLGLLTGNTALGAQTKLNHFGLWEPFDFGAFGDLHLDRNAVATDAIEHVRRRRDVEARDILVIGDTPYDIRCAQHVGAQAIAVLTGWNTRAELEAAEPDLLLDDLTDPEPILARLKQQ